MGVVRRVRLASMLAVLVGLLVGASSAAAMSTRIEISRSFASPDPTFAEDALAGGNLVKWHRGMFRSLSPTGQVRTVAVRGAAKIGPAVTLGSPTRLAFLRYTGAGLFGGASAGPIAQIETCARAPSLDGNYVAYLRVNCNTGAPVAVVVRDPTASAPAAMFAVSPPPTINGIYVPQYVSLAGDYLAYTDGGKVVVRDWRTGTVLYNQPPEVSQGCDSPAQFNAPPPSPVAGFCGIAVERDGSFWELVGSFTWDPGSGGKYSQPSLTDNCAGHVERFAPAATTAQTVVAGTACNKPIYVANGSLVFRAASGGAFVRPGSATRSLGEPGAVYGFDGTNLLAEHATCTAAAVVAIAVASDPPLSADPNFSGEPCRGLARGLHIALGARPELRVRISCPRGCVGPLVVASPKFDSNGYYRPEAASPNFVLKAGTTLRLRIKLRPNGRLVRMARARGARVRGTKAHIWVPVWFVEWIDNPRTPFSDVTAYAAHRALATIG